MQNTKNIKIKMMLSSSSMRRVNMRRVKTQMFQPIGEKFRRSVSA